MVESDATPNITRSSCNNLSNIPEGWKQEKLWGIWIKTFQNGRLKKDPRNPNNPRFHGSWKDDNRLQSFDYCLQLVKMHGNDFVDIGLAYSLRPPLCLIDLDNVIVNGKIKEPYASEIRLFDTYVEVSQSGTGIHIIGLGTPKGRIGLYDEVYPSGHWVFVTGNIMEGFTNQVKNIQPALDTLYEKHKNDYSEREKTAGNLKNMIPWTHKTFSATITETYKLNIEDFAMPLNPISRGNGVYQGECPWHGSTTGFNFIVDTRANTWKCFRNYRSAGIEHGGGSGLEAFAVSEGLIQCEDAKPGWFNDRDLQRTVFRALEDKGYQKEKFWRVKK